MGGPGPEAGESSGVTPGAAGIPQLWPLLFIFAIPFFVLPFAVETLLRRRHDQR